jgi:ribosomal protein L11 methyltransferase
MYWQLLSIQTDGHNAILLSEVLLANGALSVAIEDGAHGKTYEGAVFSEWDKPLGPLWKKSEVQAMFPAECDVPALIIHVRTALDWAFFPPYTVKNVEDRDWVKSFYADFKPVKISERLWIVPPNHEPPDAGAVNILLEPGLAFGSGEHATTRLCLQWLEKNVQGGESVIDYGCGSGILAIAASKLGAGRVVGVDIDPLAIAASQMNATRNSVDIALYTTEKMPAMAVDVVVANILAGPLADLAPLLAQCTKPGGKIALSGIINKQVDALRETYGQWFEMGVALFDGEWALVEGIKKSQAN